MFQPALAHQVKTSQAVGATLHIEPNDTPKAGEEVLVWFALTQRGGEPIPLAACQCELQVLSGSTSSQGAPAPSLMRQPALSPVNAEGYQAIPGARLTFPEVGAYQLRLIGAPQSEAVAFDAFDLAFEVTVAAALPTAPTARTATLPAPTSAATPATAPATATPLLTKIAAIGGGLVLATAGLSALAWQLRRRRS